MIRHRMMGHVGFTTRTRLAMMVAGALLAGILGGCPSVQMIEVLQPRQLVVQGPYVHAASGITLPERVDGFTRDKIWQYDEQGLDIGVGYNLVSLLHPMTATVYVYPAPTVTSIGSPTEVVASARQRMSEDEFERRKREILTVHPNAKCIEQRDVTRTENDKSYPGKLAVYEFEDMREGVKIPFRSYLYMFCYVDDQWIVKYRFTHPASLEAEEDIQALLQDLDWHPVAEVAAPPASGT